MDPNAILARDIMRRKLVTVRQDLPLVELAKVLAKNRISGAPVVDRRDRLVGIVSLSDMAATRAQESREVVSEQAYYARPDYADSGEMQALGMHIEDIGDAVVRDIMTPVVISARPDATVAELADIMGVNGIHRVLIAKNAKLLGVVSALDLIGLIPDAARRAAEREPRLILWATDLGAGSAWVGDAAVDLAADLNADLLALHVSPDIESLVKAYGQHPKAAAMQIALQERALEQLYALIKRLRDRISDVEVMARVGDPVATILELARARKPAFIVIGTKRGKAERLPGVGSVAEKLVAAALWPVLTVPPPGALKRSKKAPARKKTGA